MLYINPVDASYQTPVDPRLRAEAKQHHAAQELERYFLFTLMKEMRKTIPEDTLLGGGQMKSFFQELLDDALAGEMARSGQWGVARIIEQQISQAGAYGAGAASDNMNTSTEGSSPASGVPINQPSSGLPINQPEAGLAVNTPKTNGPTVGSAAGFPINQPEMGLPSNQPDAGVVRGIRP